MSDAPPTGAGQTPAPKGPKRSNARTRKRQAVFFNKLSELRARNEELSEARLKVAIERVGGPEVVAQALAHKAPEGEPALKWSVVCCEQSKGHQVGGLVFMAWVRLAGTPVRELKKRIGSSGATGRRPNRKPRPAWQQQRSSTGGSNVSEVRHSDGQLGSSIRIPGYEH